MKVSIRSCKILFYIFLILPFSGCVNYAYNQNYYKPQGNGYSRTNKPYQQKPQVAHVTRVRVGSPSAGNQHRTPEYEQAKREVNLWNANERELQILEYLSQNDASLKNTRHLLQATIIQLSEEINNQKSQEEIFGRNQASQKSISQLENALIDNKEKLANIDREIITAIIETKAAAAARRSTYSPEERKRITISHDNAVKKANEATKAADDAYNNLRW